MGIAATGGPIVARCATFRKIAASYVPRSPGGAERLADDARTCAALERFPTTWAGQTTATCSTTRFRSAASFAPNPFSFSNPTWWALHRQISWPTIGIPDYQVRRSYAGDLESVIARARWRAVGSWYVHPCAALSLLMATSIERPAMPFERYGISLRLTTLSSSGAVLSSRDSRRGVVHAHWPRKVIL